jgi:hypothetical protein
VRSFSDRRLADQARTSRQDPVHSAFRERQEEELKICSRQHEIKIGVITSLPTEQGIYAPPTTDARLRTFTLQGLKELDSRLSRHVLQLHRIAIEFPRSHGKATC